MNLRKGCVKCRLVVKQKTIVDDVYLPVIPIKQEERHGNLKRESTKRQTRVGRMFFPTFSHRKGRTCAASESFSHTDQKSRFWLLQLRYLGSHYTNVYAEIKAESEPPRSFSTNWGGGAVSTSSDASKRFGEMEIRCFWATNDEIYSLHAEMKERKSRMCATYVGRMKS